MVQLVGPNTKNCLTTTTLSLQNIFRVFQGANLPKKAWVLIADESDSQWISAKTEELLLPYQRQYSNNQQVSPSSVNNSSEAVLWIQNPCSATDEVMISGGAIAHGFTHAIQKFQFLGARQGWGSWGNVPRWLLEGGATFSEVFITYGSDYRTWISQPPFRNQDLKKYDLQFYKDFLLVKTIPGSEGLWAYTNQWPNQRVYDIGAHVCDVLIAMKGPTSVINLYTEFAKIGDFDQAFKNIFGITWTQAHPYVAQATYESVNWLLDPDSDLLNGK